MEEYKPKHYRNNKFQSNRKKFNLIYSALQDINEAIRSNKNSDNKEKVTTKKNKPNRAEWWTARATIALAIITGFLAVATYQLFKEATRSTDLAKAIHKIDSTLAEKRFESDTAALDADYNASLNIASLGRAYVNHAEKSDMFCSLHSCSGLKPIPSLCVGG